MIRIAHVLTEINERSGSDGGQPFALEFVTDDGRVRRLKRAIRGAREYNPSSSGSGNVSKFRYNQKEKGTMLLHDLDEGGVKSITIACIMRYNGQEVHH